MAAHGTTRNGSRAARLALLLTAALAVPLMKFARIGTTLAPPGRPAAPGVRRVSS